MFVKLIRNLLSLFPLRNVILLESFPDYADNTKAVFDEMLKRGLNKKYKLVWVFKDADLIKFKEKNVKSISLYNRLLFNYYYYSCKAKICNSNFFTTSRKGQTSIYLTHGTPLKDCSNYYFCPPGIDYMITQGPKANPLTSRVLKLDFDKCAVLGFPRNDDLIKEKKDIKKIFGNYNKIIIWYPTARQFKTGIKSDSLTALPVIHNENDLDTLNDSAKKTNTLIVLKPHFAQDNSYFNASERSNIRIIDDSFFKENNITSYEMIGASDGLITDYSSIYYDYLLCNKPIGLVWDDLKEYLANPGLIKEYNEVTKAAVKIYNIKELCKFVEDVGNDNDSLEKERIKAMKDFNVILDNKTYSSNVLDFIIEKAKL